MSTPIRVRLMIGTDQVAARLGQVIQSLAREAGFQVDMRDGADLIEDPLGERERVVGSFIDDHGLLCMAYRHGELLRSRGWSASTVARSAVARIPHWPQDRQSSPDGDMGAIGAKNDRRGARGGNPGLGAAARMRSWSGAR